MKKIYILILSVLLFLFVCGTVAIAATESPYKLESDGCITDVSMSSSKVILDGVQYYEAVVTSHIQGVESLSAIPYSVWGAIGNSDTKMFVYSMGTEDNLDFANHTVLDIVKKFEEDYPQWNAVVAVNGDFFDIETKNTASMGEPENIAIQLGDVYKTYYDASVGRGMVGTKDDGSMVYFTGGQSYRDNNYGTPMFTAEYHAISILQPQTRQVLGTYRAYEGSQGPSDKIAFFTPDSGVNDLRNYTIYMVKCDTYRRSHVGSLGTEIGTQGYFFEGEIIKKYQGRNYEVAPKGCVLLGIPKGYDGDDFSIGTYLKCERKVIGAWSGITNAVGFKQQILAEGNILLKNCYGTYNTSGDKENTLLWTADIYEYPYCWKNRTVLGFKEDGSPVVLVVKRSGHTGAYKNLGASYYELGEQLKALGCTNGFLLDGGGSSTFVVRKEDNTFQTTFVGEGTSGRKVGNAVILAVRDESVPMNLDPMIGKVTASIVENSLDISAITLERQNYAVDGALTVDAGQTLHLGENHIAYTFTPKDRNTYQIIKGSLAVTVVDTMSPTGKLFLGNSEWSTYPDADSFSCSLWNCDQTIRIEAYDNLSGVKRIEYYMTEDFLTIHELKVLPEDLWKPVRGNNITISTTDKQKNAFYIRITDNIGNSCYLTTGYVEFDTTAPVITGITNGEYYDSTQKISVTDRNLSVITVNGEQVTGTFVLEADKEATYTIIAQDLAGNATEAVIYMRPVKTDKEDFEEKQEESEEKQESSEEKQEDSEEKQEDSQEKQEDNRDSGKQEDSAKEHGTSFLVWISAVVIIGGVILTISWKYR